MAVVDLDGLEEMIRSMKASEKAMLEGLKTVVTATSNCNDNLEDGDKVAKAQCDEMAEKCNRIEEDIEQIDEIIKGLQDYLDDARDQGEQQ